LLQLIWIQATNAGKLDYTTQKHYNHTMPEYPEVFTIVKDLNKYLTHSVITQVQTIAGYKIKTEFENPHQLILLQKIQQVRQIGKHIIFALENYDLAFHLAMTGRLLIRTPDFPADSHLRLVLTLEKNTKELELRFTDVRMFGKVQLASKNTTQKLLNKLGPNVLDESLSAQYFHAILKSKKTNIKNVLLDQERVSGLGNVYATDALWIAKIHPTRQTQSITPEEAQNLLNACREILKEGIKNRGLTISDYVDAFGKPGKQQNYFRIYKRNVCTRCNTESQVMVINTRTTYFCPHCQT
jgi:formamidopyrimidine-DNA glycosylase